MAAAAAHEFLAALVVERLVVLRMREDEPDHVPEVRVGHRLKAFGHDGVLRDLERLDVGLGDDRLRGAGLQELHDACGVLDHAAAEEAVVLRLDLHVLVARADDFVRVDDVVQERVERAPAHAREVGPDLGALAIHLVADEAGAGRDLMALHEVDGAGADDLPLLGDEPELFGAGGADLAEDLFGLGPLLLAARGGQGADDRGRNVAALHLAAFDGGEEGPLPIAARCAQFRDGRTDGGRGGVPLLEELPRGVVLSYLLECADSFDLEGIAAGTRDQGEQGAASVVALHAGGDLDRGDAVGFGRGSVGDAGEAGLERAGVAPERTQLLGAGDDVLVRACEELLQDGLGRTCGRNGLAALAVDEAVERADG